MIWLPLNWPKQPHKDSFIERYRMPLKIMVSVRLQASNSNNVEKCNIKQKQKQQTQHDMCTQPQWVAATLYLNEKE